MYANGFKNWLFWNLAWTIGGIILISILIFSIGKDISGRAASIIKERQELMIRLEALDSAAAFRSGADRSEKITGRLQALLPSKDQLVSFSRNMEKIAKSNQLGFGFAFESESAATDQKPGINNFLITSRGAYSNFLSFLKSVEASDYFTSFDSFELNKKDKDFEILMRGKVFSQ